MLIDYVQGDLTASAEKVIVHGCNAKGAFGSGFAGIVRKIYPEAYFAYMEAHARSELVLGSVIWAVNAGTLVGNCITQPTYGRDGRRHISYEALRDCMRQVNETAKAGLPGTRWEKGFDRVAMPLIGADLGGGDWETISKIISDELEDVSPSVYVLPGRKLPVSYARTAQGSLFK